MPEKGEYDYGSNRHDGPTEVAPVVWLISLLIRKSEPHDGLDCGIPKRSIH